MSDDILNSILGMNRSERAIPRNGALSPQDEQSFRAFMSFDPNVREWRNVFKNKYGEAPTLDDPSYDYRKAYMSGSVPQRYEFDDVPHWDSRGKSQNHPTAWMEDYAQQFGNDPNEASTPEQLQVVNENAKRQLIDAMMQRILNNK